MPSAFKPLTSLRDAVGRRMLFPALRLMRAQLRQISDPVHLREAAARMDALAPALPDVRSVPVDAGGVRAHWLDVRGARRDRVVLYLHGGAFVAETPAFHGALLARICREVHARGLMPSYRLAPEHRYPAALDDCLAAYRWLLDQGHAPRQIVVAGDSAGGNLTLALMLRLRDEGLPLPAGAVALSPVADFTFSGASVQRNDGIDDMFSADLMAPLLPVYLAQPALRTHPHVSPVFGDFTGLPPLLLQVGSTELLLDDAVRVGQRWPGAQLQVWHGMPHVFPGFEFLPEAREATQQIGRFLRQCLADAAAAPVAGAAPVDDAAAARAEVPAAAAVAALAVRWRAEDWLYLALTMACGAAALVSVALMPLLLASPLLWAGVAAVLALLLSDAAAVGGRRLRWCLAATLLLGPGCGLSLFLLLRTRARAAASAARP